MGSASTSIRDSSRAQRAPACARTASKSHPGASARRLANGTGRTDAGERDLDNDLLAGRHLPVEVPFDPAAGALGEVVILVKPAPEASVCGRLLVAQTVRSHRFAELDGEVQDA